MFGFEDFFPPHLYHFPTLWLNQGTFKVPFLLFEETQENMIHHFYDGTILNRKGRQKEGILFFSTQNH